MNEPRATIDFETRSECSLRKFGSWRYSLDPTTEILCLAFRLPYWDEGRVGLWFPAFPHLGIEEGENFDDVAELFAWVMEGGLIEAHNAWFERGIWTNVFVPRGAPPIAHHQWRCSAAKAATHALPRNLEDASEVLQLDIRKDLDGHKVMKKITQPRKPLKREREAWANQHGAGTCVACKGRGKYKKQECTSCKGKGVLSGDLVTVPPMPTLWHESPALFHQLWAYCCQDVLAEESLSASIPDLTPAETDLYLLDQAINERGFQLDQEAVTVALSLIADETKDLNAQLTKITNGRVKKATQRTQMMAWFGENGLPLFDTQRATIEDALKDDELVPTVRKALEIVRELGRSSTAKYQAMRRWACDDGRVRGGLLYHGAATGRWSGSGVQPHNFVRGTIKDLEALWTVLKKGNRQEIRTQYKSVMDALANGLRGAICAAPGCVLYVADYASIEARVLLWLAGDEDGLDLFRRGEDVYCNMASSIYKRRITKDDSNERQLGKATILGCGYQMGGPKFVSTAAIYGVVIDEGFARFVVETYRAKYWRVKQLWYDQEEAAIQAVESGEVVHCGYVQWFVEGEFLYCELPSGRRLAYPHPEIREDYTSWGALKEGLTYEGINTYNHQWMRQKTYGGSLVENIVQAISRDIMADAMLRCEQSGTYQPVLSVHDELIAEAADNDGDVAQFERLLTECPPWATGCPIEASGWAGFRYKK